MNVPARGGAMRRTNDCPGLIAGVGCCVVPVPTGNTVVVAFEFDPMPVNCGGLRGTIDHLDFYWLVAKQHDGRPIN